MKHTKLIHASVLLALMAASQVGVAGTLYLVNDDDDDSLYTVNTTTAAVTKIGQAGATDGNAEGLAPSATPGVFLYSVNNSEDLDEVNVDGSGYTRVGGGNTLDDCDRGLAFNTATGKLYGSDNGDFCEINPATGTTTSLPGNPDGDDMEGLAADPVNNYIYGIDNDERLIRFDVAGNSWSVIGDTVNIGSGNDIGLAYDPDQQVLYAAENNGELYAVNPSTGLATLIGDTGLSGGDYGLAFIPDGTSDVARFQVTKTFSDGNTAEVDVMLSCNSGLPLEQDFTIAGDGAGVTFVVTDIPGTGADCEVTETGGPAGYTASFNGGDGCTWTDVTTGLFTCEITNEADDATYTVVKDWVQDGTGGDIINAVADVTIKCDAMIDGCEKNGLSTKGVGSALQDVGLLCANVWYDETHWYKSGDLGDGDTLEASVDVTGGSATCSATESIAQSGVESTSVGCGNTTLGPGASATCTFTNTVFFEGIPTLSQYGLAVLALLMLGVGFVGMRRFV